MTVSEAKLRLGNVKRLQFGNLEQLEMARLVAAYAQFEELVTQEGNGPGQEARLTAALKMTLGGLHLETERAKGRLARGKR